MVVDDYAHHPTEIKATLAAASNSGWKRVLALFQPHRYSRTKALLGEFAGAFHDADEVFITEIYAASEAAMAGVTGEARGRGGARRRATPTCITSRRSAACARR